MTKYIQNLSCKTSAFFTVTDVGREKSDNPKITRSDHLNNNPKTLIESRYLQSIYFAARFRRLHDNNSPNH